MLLNVFKKIIFEPFENGDTGNIIGLLSFLLAFLTFIGIIIRKLFLSNAHIKIIIDKDQSLILRITSSNINKNNKICFVLYSMKFLGIRKCSTSIKEFKFFVKIDKKWIEGNKVNIYINYIYSKNEGNIDCIVAGNKEDKVVIMFWKDLNNLINKKIDYSDVLIGSAVFSFNESIEEILKVNKMKFLVIDNFNKKYVCYKKNELALNYRKDISVFDFEVKL